MMRPNWEEYLLGMAQQASTRSACIRRKVGAVVYDIDTHEIIKTGYNGTLPKAPECEEACPRAFSNVPVGSSYDTGPGTCIYTHAEANALLRAGRDAIGRGIACTETPCAGCCRLIWSAGIVQILTPKDLEKSTSAG